MFLKLFGWFITSKGAKVGAVSGGGILAVLLGFQIDTNARFHQLITQKAEQKIFVKEYIGLSLKPIQIELKNLKDETRETKSLVREIHRHLLRSKRGGGK